MVFSRLRQIPRTIWAVLMLGFFLRAGVVLLHQRPLISDERDYHQLAVALVKTGTYGLDEQPTAFRPIGYPLMVAGVYALFGESPLAVKFLQAFVDTLTALLLFLLLKKQPLRVQVMALAMWVLYLPAMLYANFLLSETVFTFLLVLTVVLVDRGALSNGTTAVVIGVLLGMLTLLKTSMFLFIMAISVIMPLISVPLKRYKFVVLGALLIIGPWVVRNSVSLGKATLGTNGGINLLIGNNPNTTGAYRRPVTADALTEAHDEVSADEHAYSYAFNYIKEEPVQFVLNGFRKIAHLVSSEGGLLVWSFHESPEETTQRYGSKYMSVPPSLIVLVNLPYILLLLVGLVGFFHARPDTLWWVVLCLIACWIAIHAVFFGGSRFHFPLMPFFAAFAAPVVLDLRTTISQLSASRRTLLFTVLGGLSVVWIVEAYTVINAA